MTDLTAVKATLAKMVGLRLNSETNFPGYNSAIFDEHDLDRLVAFYAEKIEQAHDQGFLLGAQAQRDAVITPETLLAAHQHQRIVGDAMPDIPADQWVRKLSEKRGQSADVLKLVHPGPWSRE